MKYLRREVKVKTHTKLDFYEKAISINCTAARIFLHISVSFRNNTMIYMYVFCNCAIIIINSSGIMGMAWQKNNMCMYRAGIPWLAQLG